MPYKDPETQREYLARHYKKNRSTYYAAAQASRRRRGEKVRELRKRPCMDCEKTYHPDVMEFHHRNPADKEFVVGQMINRWGWKKIEAEIAKCDLLCANCHIMRHVAMREGSGTRDSNSLPPVSNTGMQPVTPVPV